LIEHSIQNGSILFSVRVVPRASRSEIIGEQGGVLRVRISAAPVDGAANEELVRVLARDFNVPRRAISIITGHSARLKRIRIEGLSPEKLKLAENKSAAQNDQ
jgi:uncharacterized protein (TIGR00251 family)